MSKLVARLADILYEEINYQTEVDEVNSNYDVGVMRTWIADNYDVEYYLKRYVVDSQERQNVII